MHKYKWLKIKFMISLKKVCIWIEYGFKNFVWRLKEKNNSIYSLKI